MRSAAAVVGWREQVVSAAASSSSLSPFDVATVADRYADRSSR